MKKFLSLLLAAVLLCSLVACGGGNNSSTPNSQPTSSTGSDVSGTGDGEEPEAYQPLEIPEELLEDPVANWDEISSLVADYTMSDFNEAYADAKAETDVDVRLVKMAVAEAKLLESGVMAIGSNGGVNYAINHQAPHTVPSVMWGGDIYKYQTALIVKGDPIAAEDYLHIREMWNDANTAGTDAATYLADVESYLTGQGYTLSDTYNTTFSTTYVTWDPLADSHAESTVQRAFGSMSMVQYDVMNVAQPALAESWNISDDGLTYTFHLRDDIKWVDQQGREVAPLVADDFVAGMQHVCDAGGGLEDLLRGIIVGIDDYIDGVTDDFSTVGIKAVDEHTVEYTLQTATPYFMTEFTYSHLAPLCRSWYESMGGKFGADFDSAAEDYRFGTGPDTVVFCGPYLPTNITEKAQMTWEANPSYYDAENVRIKTINYWYNDGSDVVKTFEDLKNDKLTGLGLNASTLEIAQNEDYADGKTWFDQFAYVTESGSGTFLGSFNLYRQAYANYNDETAVVSPKSDEDKDRTRAALLDQNFRLALLHGWDRASWRTQSTGNEELAKLSIRNTFVPGNFSSLTKDVTFDINGTETTFPTGTWYGEIVQAQLEADGSKMNVWDDETKTTDTFDGYYNVEAAKEYFEAAKSDLAQQGIEISAENPIYIDLPYTDYTTAGQNVANAWKQNIEEVFDGEVIMNLVPTGNSDNGGNVQFYAEMGYEMNYDWYFSSGWNPDYGDASSYLDTIVPGGYMVKILGIY